MKKSYPSYSSSIEDFHMKLYSVFSALMTSITLIALIAGSGGNLVFEFLFLSSLEIEEQIFSQKAKNYKIFLRNN